jgi:hypothetical protein
VARRRPKLAYPCKKTSSMKWAQVEEIDAHHDDDYHHHHHCGLIMIF